MRQREIYLKLQKKSIFVRDAKFFEGLFTFDWLGAADAHWWPFQMMESGGK